MLQRQITCLVLVSFSVANLFYKFNELKYLFLKKYKFLKLCVKVLFSKMIEEKKYVFNLLETGLTAFIFNVKVYLIF